MSTGDKRTILNLLVITVTSFIVRDPLVGTMILSKKTLMIMTLIVMTQNNYTLLYNTQGPYSQHLIFFLTYEVDQ